MILQQYYTRERRGIFRTTDGYDTIAKSPLLDNNLIKKVFHSYCFYDAPRELQIAGEKDPHKYPQALTFLSLDTKDAILGQSVYVPVDFTGQRSTFFTHNYFISADMKENLIKYPEKILYTNGFKTGYDIEQGSDLEEVRDLSYTKQLYNEQFVNDLFKQLGITQEIFKKLLYAVHVSVTSRKKIYIALDVEVGHISTYSKQLLLCLLESLPYGIRRVLGFISYIQKPESKKNINIMFVDKESIRHGISGTENDFIFDFSTERFTNLDSGNHPYLDFIWNNRGNQSINNSLYELIDQVLKETTLPRPASMEVYDQLAIIFQVIRGDDSIYNTFKDDIFAYIIQYVNEKNIGKQMALNNLASRLIKKELEEVSSKGSYMTNQFAQNLIPYYSLTNNENRNTISKLFLMSLLNAKRLGKQQYISALFGIIQSSRDLIQTVIGQIMSNVTIKDNLLNDYVGLRLGMIVRLNQWMKEIESLRDLSPHIITDSYFQEESAKTLLTLLKEENNIVFSGKKVYEQLSDFIKGSKANFTINDIEYVEAVERQLDELIIGSISIGTITEYDLQSLRISQANDSNKVKILYGLKDFMTLRNHKSKEKIKELIRQATQMEQEEIQEAIMNLTAEFAGDSFYEGLLLASYKGETYGNGEYDYEKLLSSIYRSKGKEKVYSFILWSVNREEFLGGSNERFNPEYAAAIRKYFRTVDPEAFKNSDVRKRFFHIEKPGIQRLFRKINYELASKFEKIMIRYGKRTLRITGAIIIAGIVLTGIGFGAIKGTEWVMEKMGTSEKVPEDDELPDNKEGQPPVEAKPRNEKPVGYEPDTLLPDKE